MTDPTELARRSLSGEPTEEFERRVAAQAADLRAAVDREELDNPGFAVGLEMEVYAVDDAESVAGDEPGRLRELPPAVFDGTANKELGLHNAELNTDPDAFDTEGLAAQADRIREAFEAAQRAAHEQGCHLVLDAMWTHPPEGGTGPYLGAVEDRDGVTVAANMRADPRYVAIDNEAIRAAGGAVPLDLPGVSREFPSMLFESLATSIQPHLQVPTADAFPAYYNAAIRTLGPVLALSTNSPFLPPDLYDSPDRPREVVDETHHELRIAVFEQSVNHTPNRKVRVPADVDDTVETIDNVVGDDLCAPFLREWLIEDDRESFADRLWEFDYKRSTYWRWLRCVVGGDPVAGACDERSLRIEYRPIPTQPTITDTVAMQVLTVGLVRGLVAADHPLPELPWADAEEAFYAAAESGLDADLAWLTADGVRTTDSEVVFEEVFEYARVGLREAGVPEATADRYLAPIEARWEAGATPSQWKKARVREGLDDGLSFGAAVRSMQADYIERSRETDSFAEWL
jgi:hypothetical protein